jgi:Tol biopolymer transport system component
MTIASITSPAGLDFHPSISPDGKQIAFSREGPDGNVDVYVKPISGTPRRLTSDPSNDLHPSWSPDGQSIAFLRSNPDGASVIVVRSAGGDEKSIISPGKFDAGHTRSSSGPLTRLSSPGPAWSPDGRSLAFRQCPSGRTGGCPLYLISPADSQVRRLTDQVAGTSDLSPTWSPDGARIAYVRFTSYASGDIYVVAKDRGTALRITDESRDIHGLSWTADGQNLVFSSNRAGPYSLWKVSLHDRAIAPIHSSGDNAVEPVVSKDGRLLVYTAATVNMNVWRVDLAQGGMQPLIASARQNQNAAWSPDGKRIVFASNRSGTWELWIARADGSESVPLTNIRSVALGRLQFSPDGRRIVFDSAQDRPDVYIVAAAGGAPRRLMSTPGDRRTPAWSRDGHWIYFAYNIGGATRICRVPANGGDVQVVIDRSGSDFNEAPDGKSLYFVRNDEPGIWQASLPAGPARVVPGLENVNPRRWWSVGTAGIWLYDEKAVEPAIFFYSFTTQKLRQLVRLDRNIPVATPSLSVSPDGKYLLFSKVDGATSNLMAIRGSW